MQSIDPVDICPTRRTKHRCVPGRWSLIAMRSRVCRVVRFRLNDDPANTMYQQTGPDERRSDSRRIVREEVVR